MRIAYESVFCWFWISYLNKPFEYHYKRQNKKKMHRTFYFKCQLKKSLLLLVSSQLVVFLLKKMDIPVSFLKYQSIKSCEQLSKFETLLQIDSFNVNLAVFLKHLRLLSERNDIVINEKTCNLLIEAVYSIDRVIANATIDESSDKNDIDFVLDLNEKQFKLRPYIICRLCSVSVSFLNY